ncbi:MAG: protein kinase [Pirellulales bacterium]|nr:protein kinase [Pirellulales bacterium]
MHFEQLGPYKIGKRIGRGGMGAVFEGVNSETGETAAIKVLNPHLADDHAFRERFEIEIETLKKLRHPNIVRMYGFGEQEGYLYYAMELVKGRSVEEEIQGGKKYTWQEVVRHGIHLLKALRHAHDNGVVHRDIKPANILIAADGEVKLTDFGIARLFGNTRLTMEGGLVGTAEFMSPEQAGGDRVTPQSDLYSLGGVMFTMLAGRPPFRTSSLGEMLHKQRFEEPPPLSRFAPHVPVELQEFIAGLLAKDPKLRGANALVLSRQLAAMEHGLSIVSSRPIPEEIPPPENVSESNRTISERPAARDLPAQTRLASTNVVVGPIDPTSPTMDAPTPSVVPVAPRGPATPVSPRAPSVAPSAAATRKTGLAAQRDDGELQWQEPARATVAESRFVTVEEDEQRRAALERETSHVPAILQIALLAISLAGLAALGWYFMRPPTAASLFQQIEAAAESDNADALLGVADQVQVFLSRFPRDERAATVRRYEDEIDLLRMEQRFRLRLRFLGSAAELTPVERDFLEATNLETTEPERAAEKLAAIIELFGGSDEPATTTQVIEMARRQLKQLRANLDRTLPQYRQLVEEQLRRAEQLRATEPKKAMAAWQSIIKLYGDKPWAADQVAKAKAALGE